MKNIRLFNVAPSVPKELKFLEILARNMWWCWNYDAIELFRRINPPVWRETLSNPLVFLSSIPQKRLEELASDDGFLNHLEQVRTRFETETLSPGAVLPGGLEKCIAYFSLEYGIHESVRIYSGGLGILAGDHLKAASEMGLPLVGLGLLYKHGYFQQYLNSDGWQQESYPENEIHNMPLVKAHDRGGNEITVSIPLPNGNLKAVVWLLQVGRVPLYLLDANIPGNPPEFRRITSNLYDPDRLVRLRQELLLGIGGIQALGRLELHPAVCHINEGHAAFLGPARIAALVRENGFTNEVAMEIAARTTVFTTHTPVPAGNEAFPNDLLLPHLQALRETLGISPDTIISWGQMPNGMNHHELLMTVLGMKVARHRNGVSRLHGRVARRMWSSLWPDRSEDEIPIGHITNGIHVSSWLSPDNSVLYDRYLGPAWRGKLDDGGIVKRIADIPDEELWRARGLSRSRLVRVARDLMERQFRARNATRAELSQAKSVLDHDALTIGFARRFATYKRATLLFKDIKRIEAIISNQERPVQFIFAGKAHPADNAGKDFIRQVVHFARRPGVRRHVIFIENYDMRTARRLLQGVDVWLNTPRRPQEASGTSGMKAAINGAINLSILDGWWDEGYSKERGWAIGDAEEHDDNEYQDAVESQALYNILENEVIPMFYDRHDGDLPRKWIQMMKESIIMGLGEFDSSRMMRQYHSEFYAPAMVEYDALTAEKADKAVKVITQHDRVRQLWGNVHVDFPVTSADLSMLHVGDRFSVSVDVDLGSLRPEEVDVQVYYGPVNPENRIMESHVETMSAPEDKGNGRFCYRHEITCNSTGRYGFTARAVPHGYEWHNEMPGFTTWANGV